MITALIIFIASAVLVLFVSLLSAITWLIPNWIELGINEYVGYLGYLQGVLPLVADPARSGLAGVVGLVDILIYALDFVGAIFTVRLIMLILHYVPFIGISRSDSFKADGSIRSHSESIGVSK